MGKYQTNALLKVSVLTRKLIKKLLKKYEIYQMREMFRWARKSKISHIKQSRET